MGWVLVFRCVVELGCDLACYHPLRAVMVKAGSVSTISFKFDDVGKGISLPCGRCIGCRLERARQWAVRIMHEAEFHAVNSFITLTYDDGHLPKGGSLDVRSCQLFLKRLRFELDPIRIRFFLCGEYGEATGRPHYHAIIFGYGFPDKVALADRKNGEHILYRSPLLERVWSFGISSVGSVTFDSANYVANYATKKVVGKDAGKHYGGRKPEFLLMSRRPGIGRAWIEKFTSDVYPSDEVIVKERACRPPRYYDQVLEAKSPLLSKALKDKRELDALDLHELVGDELVPVVSGERSALRLAVRERIVEAKLKLSRKEAI